jgi:PPP family 3-phenylpropionic acid transporter
MGLYRGIGSLAFSGGAILGGRTADAYSLAFVFNICAAFYLIGALLSLMVQEQGLPATDRRGTAPSQAAPHPPGQRLPLLFLSGVLLWTAAHSASASMWPNYMDSLGYSKTAIGSLWGLAAFVEMPAMFVAGLLSDLLGRALLLAAGGFAIALVQFGYIAVAASLPALMGVQIIRGFGFGSYTATSMTFTAEYGEQRTRGVRSGLFHSTASAGQLLGMFMGGTVAQFAGFTVMYLACSVLAIGSGICFLAMRRSRKQTLTPEHAGA